MMGGVVPPPKPLGSMETKKKQKQESNMKHTKGPWEVAGVDWVREDGCNYLPIINDEKREVARVVQYLYQFEPMSKSNANLIASAPEMKKALYDIIDFASDSMPNYSLLNHDSPSYNPSAAKQYDLMKKIVDIANRAIIKAEGSE